MSNYSLTSDTPLNGFSQDFDGISLSEVSRHSLVSMATPAGQDEALAAVIKDVFKTRLPEVGSFTTSTTDDTRFLGLQARQCFVLFESSDVDAVAALKNKTADAAYLCDQSDSWVMLRLEGARSQSVMERICPLDLHPTVFNDNSVLRTMMEHLSVIVIREGSDRYLMLSPRSSAQSFLHMVMKAVENTG